MKAKEEIISRKRSILKKKLLIKKICLKKEDKKSFSDISKILEAKTYLEKIDHVSWEDFPSQPKVLFRSAYAKNTIFLKFYVQEDKVSAKRTQINSEIHKDSCVEFFFAIGDDENYYNLEINAIGTVHLAYGQGRNNRTFIPSHIISSEIKTYSTLGNTPFESTQDSCGWEMLVCISSSAFFYHPSVTLDGLEARGNFYKCFDDSEKKHYLSWNPVETKKPDFHKPGFFGIIQFE